MTTYATATNKNLKIDYTKKTEGGEATIYELVNPLGDLYPNTNEEKYLIKIYKSDYLDGSIDTDINRRDYLFSKIQFMISVKDKYQLIINNNTWPIEFVKDENDIFCGFTMRKVCGEKLEDILEKMNEGDTSINNVKCAEKLSELIFSFHDNNIYVGDLHPSNIIIDNNSDPHFVDIDSFTIGNTGNTLLYHNYGATHPGYGYNVNNKDFQISTYRNKDFFILAIIIYQLFNNGEHPFDAIESGTNIPIDIDDRQDRIDNCKYAFSNGYEQYSLHPLKRSNFPKEMIEGFDDAFENHKMLSASDWVTILKSYSEKSTECKKCHQRYIKNINIDKCPYCDSPTQIKKDESSNKIPWAVQHIYMIGGLAILSVILSTVTLICNSYFYDISKWETILFLSIVIPFLIVLYYCRGNDGYRLLLLYIGCWIAYTIVAITSIQYVLIIPITATILIIFRYALFLEKNKMMNDPPNIWQFLYGPKTTIKDHFSQIITVISIYIMIFLYIVCTGETIFSVYELFGEVQEIKILSYIVVIISIIIAIWCCLGWVYKDSSVKKIVYLIITSIWMVTTTCIYCKISLNGYDMTKIGDLLMYSIIYILLLCCPSRIHKENIQNNILNTNSKIEHAHLIAILFVIIAIFFCALSLQILPTLLKNNNFSQLADLLIFILIIATGAGYISLLNDTICDIEKIEEIHAINNSLYFLLPVIFIIIIIGMIKYEIAYNVVWFLLSTPYFVLIAFFHDTKT